MTSLTKRVRAALDQRCIVESRLRKEGCTVLMTDAPHPRLVVNFDKPGSPLHKEDRRCDYLLVAEETFGTDWVVPLELKRGRLRADRVVPQLQAGAHAAETLVPHDASVRFRPVAVTGNVPKHDREELKKASNAIQFHSQSETVRLMTCGDELAKVLYGSRPSST